MILGVNEKVIILKNIMLLVAAYVMSAIGPILYQIQKNGALKMDM